MLRLPLVAGAPEPSPSRRIYTAGSRRCGLNNSAPPAGCCGPISPPATRYHVAAMVTAEADKLLRVAPNYYALADGHLRFPGDTKAEEDMWAATIFALAAVMLPKHPHARLWRQQEATYKIASYATAADDTSTDVINGRP